MIKLNRPLAKPKAPEVGEHPVEKSVAEKSNEPKQEPQPAQANPAPQEKPAPSGTGKVSVGTRKLSLGASRKSTVSVGGTAGNSAGSSEAERNSDVESGNSGADNTAQTSGKVEDKPSSSSTESNVENGETDSERMLDPTKPPKLSLGLAKKARQTAEAAMEEQTAARENVLAGFDATLAPEVYKVEGFDAEEFEGALTIVHQKLQEGKSDMGDFILGIFRNLNRYPEVSTALTEEQIGVVVGGILSVKKTELSTTKPKKKTLLAGLEGMSNDEVLNMEF